MVRRELISAIQYAQTLTQSGYTLFMSDIYEFGHFEMLKPRTDSPWQKRFDDWKCREKQEVSNV